MAWSYSAVDQFGSWADIRPGVQAAAKAPGTSAIRTPVAPVGGSGIPGMRFRYDGRRLPDRPGK